MSVTRSPSSPKSVLSDQDMAPGHRETALGGCSFCGAAITIRHVIIEYNTTAGEPDRWAECPNCGEIVDPVSEGVDGS